MNDKYLIPGAVLLAGLVVGAALVYTKLTPPSQLASVSPSTNQSADNQPSDDQAGKGGGTDDQDNQPAAVDKSQLAKESFSENTDKQICKEDGKPVIYLFSTTWCPHCQWIKETFNKVAKEYVSQGKIKAYHWEVDTNDDTLTEAVETKVPENALAIYQEFNPRGSIPTFIFGCKYYRIGSGPGREQAQALDLEESEFRTLIDKLIAG